MRATLTATDLFSSRGRVDVLRELCGVEVPLTAADVAARTRMTHPAASAALRSLTECRVVYSSPAGRGSVYWINRDSVYVKSMLVPLFVAERKVSERMEQALHDSLGEYAISVVLFGSYARGEQRPDSDVDVVVVVRDAETKARLQDEVPSLNADFLREFGAFLSLIIYDRDDAAGLKERAPGLYESLWNEGITVLGPRVEAWNGLESGRQHKTDREIGISKVPRESKRLHGDGTTGP